jgi:hypothetical protein
MSDNNPAVPDNLKIGWKLCAGIEAKPYREVSQEKQMSFWFTDMAGYFQFHL